MSHVVTVKTQVRDPVAIAAACERLRLPAPVFGTTKLFAEEARGWQVALREWRYPLVCDVERGQLLFDNFEGRWGDPARLDEFVQSYAVSMATLEARRQGHTVFEQPLADGSVRLTIQVGGVA